MPHFDINAIPDKLVNAFKENKGSLFIGAGLSVNAGLPTWSGLLTELLAEVQSQTRISPEDYKECSDMILDSGKFLMLAEELKEKLGEADFRKFIIDKFSEMCPAPTKLHEELIDMKYNFIVTTNYDTLIEDAFTYSRRKSPSIFNYDDSIDVANYLWERRKFILKAHGDASKYNNGIVMTEKDYRKLIYSRPGYQAVLQVLFTTNTLLFLGASLSDPEIKMLLSFLHSAYSGGGPSHFALMPKDKMKTVEAERWRKDYRITMVPYDPADNHVQIEEFITEFKRLTL